MSEPIIIETPAPPTLERLVLVPADAVSRTASEPALNVHTSAGRDATPADLARGGYVRDGDTRAGARTMRAGWLVARVAALAELDEQRARAEKAEGLLIQRETELRLAREDGDVSEQGRHAAIFEANRRQDEWKLVVARAEKAERERDEAKELARVLEVERDAALDARNACAAERNEARAELARLTAPGEGSLDNGELVAAITRGGSYRAEGFDVVELQEAYRLGVAHERARQQPAKDRATDEELLALFNSTVEANSKTMAFPVRSAVAAVAARVRKERCLVAQAVGMMPGVRSLTIWHEGPGANTVGVRVNDIKAIMRAPTDVPATLARLLGEVSR